MTTTTTRGDIVRKILTLLLVLGLFTAACSTDKDDEEAGTGDGDPAETSADEPADDEPADDEPADDEPGDEPDDSDEPEDEDPVDETPEIPAIEDPRAPGVTDTSVTVAALYPALRPDGLVNWGEVEPIYEIVVNAINERGRMHGRTIDLVMVGEATHESDGGTAACVEATQDQPTFIVVGWADGDPLCYIEQNETQLLGSSIAADRLVAAKAGWWSVGDSEDVQAAGIQAMIDEGIVGDRVAVLGTAGFDEEAWDLTIGPLLAENGIDATEAFIDTTSGDANAVFASVDSVLARFEAEGLEQVFIVSSPTAFFATARFALTDYSPQLLFTQTQGIDTYITTEGNDLSVMEGALIAGSFDARNRYAELGGATAECLGIVEAGGIELKPLNELVGDEPAQIIAALQACQNLYIVEAVLEAAGPELNYGTFQTAFHRLGEIDVPGQPKPLNYGPPPSTDGDLVPQLYSVDTAAGQMIDY